jgi:hypothetical protein
LLPADYKEQRMVYQFTFEVIDWCGVKQWLANFPEKNWLERETQ